MSFVYCYESKPKITPPKLDLSILEHDIFLYNLSGNQKKIYLELCESVFYFDGKITPNKLVKLCKFKNKKCNCCERHKEKLYNYDIKEFNYTKLLDENRCNCNCRHNLRKALRFIK